jgi:chemotaxis signal transduction protein
MTQLRNVVMFELGGGEAAADAPAGDGEPPPAGAPPRRPFAAELRWVREITTLGFVTFLPSAPLPICGVVNVHGAIVPVIDLGELLQRSSAGLPRQGDPALLVEVDHIVAAFRVDAIRHVASLPQPAAAHVLDRDGTAVPLVDLPALVRRCAQLVSAAARATSGGAA